MLKIGVIADDFTGATDIASFWSKTGCRQCRSMMSQPGRNRKDATR